MNKEKLHSGSSKTIYTLDDEQSIILSFDDKLKTEDGKIIDVSGKGALCNKISAFLMEKMNLVGIDNHFISKINMKQQKVHFVDMYPIQVRISNVACGRYIKDFNMQEGFVFETPILDFRIKNSELNYPIINEQQAFSFGWLSKYEIKELRKQALRVNDFLSGFFASSGIRLVECNLEFGRMFNGDEFVAVLADEISPDNCRLWDLEDNTKLSYEIAVNEIDELTSSYNKIATLIGAK